MTASTDQHVLPQAEQAPTDDAWISYKERTPPEAGIYQWRVASGVVPGLTLVFLSRHRLRGAGHALVLSPEFDSWNGWDVIVPKGTQWKPTTCTSLGSGDYGCIEIEGQEIEPCPFCRKRPVITGSPSWIGAGPQEWREWYLRCCSTARALTRSDPRVAIKDWNDHLLSYRAKAADDAVAAFKKALEAKAAVQVAYWRMRQAAEKCLEDGISEDGLSHTPIGDHEAWQGGYCNGRMSEADWWLKTLEYMDLRTVVDPPDAVAKGN